MNEPTNDRNELNKRNNGVWREKKYQIINYDHNNVEIMLNKWQKIEI